MRNDNIRSLRLLTVFASLVASQAWAADSGFYFGLNAGVSDFDSGLVGSPNLFVAQGLISTGGNPGTIFGTVTPILGRGSGPGAIVLAGGITSGDVDQRDFTFSAAVGYTFNRYLSLELAYADLGELTSTQVTTFQSTDPTVMISPFALRSTQELSAETLSISVLGSFPLSERWSLFARGGYGYSESDVEFRTGFTGQGVQGGIARFDQDFDSEDYVLGAGVGFKLSPRWSLRADYERLFEAGAESVDVDRFGLSAIYRL
jgi:opacity protein-like surface antigen